MNHIHEKIETPRIAFFGTPNLAVEVLEILNEHNLLPVCVVTNPDMPQGRKMQLTPSPVKVWATSHGVPTYEPESLVQNNHVQQLLEKEAIDLCIVVAYGKIIPQDILDIPKFGTLNVHPSLLPTLRGASPIRSAIREDKSTTGVTIMLLDALLDHGPILAQKEFNFGPDIWPLRGRELDTRLAHSGGILLVETIPEWIAGNIVPREQEHAQATFCSKITKEMGEINLAGDGYMNLLKIRAFDGWPGTYFFYEKNEKNIRVKIIDAELNPDKTLRILRVIPEGKSEMSYDDFIRNTNVQKDTHGKDQ